MTQHYVGTKIVEAWPQKREACNCATLEDAACSRCGQPEQDGYAVKYADGYTSWSPAATFEAAYLPLGHIGNLKPHEQRLVAEYVELDARLKKLEAFLEADAFLHLGSDDQSDLQTQANCMRAYANVLAARVDRIGS